MEFRNLKWTQKDALVVLTVDRPTKLNALTDETIDELSKAFTAIRVRADLHAVILTGGGEKAFIAGADIAELAALDPVRMKASAEKGQRLLDSIETLGKPVIAAINGYALGGGLEVALACTVRVASDRAMVGLPEVTLGIMPGYGGTQRLPRLIGKGRALEWMLTGGKMDAAEAYRVGLVNRVVAPEQLLGEAELIARRMIANGPLAVRACLEAVHRGTETSIEQGLALEATLFGLLASTRDTREGLTAFLEKRKPVFKGE